MRRYERHRREYTGGLMQQQVNHVSHVSFIYTRQNLPAAKLDFEHAFQITDWDGPTEIRSLGVVQIISMSAGIELIAPLGDENNPFAQHIRDKGEGFFALVFGVADVRAAGERAKGLGLGLLETEDGSPWIMDGLHVNDGEPAHPNWDKRFRRFEEMALKPVRGMNLFLGQIEPI
jgi:hypothetical protein